MTLSFPLSVSNSSLTTFRSCEAKSLWSKFRNLEPNQINANLHSGSCFATALEAARRSFYIEGNDLQKARLDGIRALWLAWGTYEPGEREKKTWLTTTYAFIHYLKVWPFDEDYLEPWDFGQTRKGIEFDFAVPLPINHPETGEPILYTGRADMFAKFQSCPWVEDDKSTGSIGPSWAEQWALSSQMMGTTWVANEYGIPAPGAIIRVVSIQVKQNKDAEAIVPFSAQMLKKWHRTTLRTVEDMIRAWKEGYFRPAFNYTCNYCEFPRLCEAVDPEKWLMHFKQREERK